MKNKEDCKHYKLTTWNDLNISESGYPTITAFDSTTIAYIENDNEGLQIYS